MSKRPDHPAYMRRQGHGWIVGVWDESVRCYREDGERDYWSARRWVGAANCSAERGGKCSNPQAHEGCHLGPR
jgi:hypothetical protein